MRVDTPFGHNFVAKIVILNKNLFISENLRIFLFRIFLGKSILAKINGEGSHIKFLLPKSVIVEFDIEVHFFPDFRLKHDWSTRIPE